MLEDNLRRHAGRALKDVAHGTDEAGISPISMTEIDAEVKAARAVCRKAEHHSFASHP